MASSGCRTSKVVPLINSKRKGWKGVARIHLRSSLGDMSGTLGEGVDSLNGRPIQIFDIVRKLCGGNARGYSDNQHAVTHKHAVRAEHTERFAVVENHFKGLKRTFSQKSFHFIGSR